MKTTKKQIIQGCREGTRELKGHRGPCAMSRRDNYRQWIKFAQELPDGAYMQNGIAYGQDGMPIFRRLSKLLK